MPVGAGHPAPRLSGVCIRCPAGGVGSVITEHQARPASIVSGIHVAVLARSSASRYGARYFAAIFVGGDQVGVSVISELNP
jgi:hypothetical protein